MRMRAGGLVPVMVSALLVACGGAQVAGEGSTSTVTIDPTAATVSTGGKEAFTAKVASAASQAVTWRVEETTGGTVTAAGIYTAPATAGTFHVIVTSQVDATQSATAVVVVSATLPSTPSNLVARATSSSAISLTWTNNATNQTGFVILRSTTSATAGFTQVGTAGAAGTSYTDSGLSPSTAYWYEVAAVNSYGDSAYSNVATATTPASGSGTATRPSYNTGTGFFTLDGKIYDANGNQFIPMGVDTAHWDFAWSECSTNCGIPNSGANINRMEMYQLTTGNASRIQADMNLMIANHIVPMAMAYYNSSGAASACNTTTAMVNDMVQEWVNVASIMKPFEKYAMINIANEWGPANSTVWRDTYISAVTTLRNAGYLGTLVIDAGGCGQDPYDIINYGAAVLAADPQQNIIFSEHIYGNWTVAGLVSGMQALAATGLPVIIGEFGPGVDYGPSPTLITPLSIMQEADALGMGWIAWAWDDSSTPGFLLAANGSTLAFSLTNGVPTHGAYPNNTDLTAYGNTVVLEPTYGLFNAAKPASIFP
ncbi:MAG TPA: fibronectin type III domain-containing protein [Anaeromyxobacter sp.]|nr:fibronectin type III domain-containing protein [Anaeromyxobacter sp.]